MSPFADADTLTIDAEFDYMCDINMCEEPLSSSSKEEVSKVLQEWTSDEESVDMDIMEVDEQIGSNFLSDELFGGPCPSPVTPQEEFMSLNISSFEDKYFASPAVGVLDQKYKQAFQKLSESMKRSQETRKALYMKTDKANDEYERRNKIKSVLESIEKSQSQIHSYLGPIAAEL
eukprot:CAMPEP_0202457818 /NCGR_PEP_ID=MMETSP1360-20130828/14722_1 /ASSEMBLY_ACC=CAM_ASM_000848 /TAXON_ID=515479 /ORGANISM="Licmophora paradoxa, Strain CCMP2313" /LENGTH=174 /DNA_ID=CAMNT_0049077983 /DNA_START=37 /DNA_END=561 /DNA_ORIENTATION=-